MKPDEFKSRVNAVADEMSKGFENFDAALREERRRYWLLLMDGCEKTVEDQREAHRRQESNPYRAAMGLGFTALGEIVKLAAKSDMAGYPFTKFGDGLSKVKELVIAVSPDEGISMLGDFEMLELPRGEWRKQDEKGRLLLTPAEFQLRMQDLKSNLASMEEPFPLPIEIEQAATALSGDHRSQI
jgi:hypothetical protein